MKLSIIHSDLLFTALGLIHLISFASRHLFVGADSASQSIQNKLIEKCCQIGKEKAVESPKFNCKMGARDALVSGQPKSRGLLALTASSLLERDPNFADQCEMVLESCCMGYHRGRNCDSGKQFAKSGAACMDVELSKEATIATESFNDCCMSCSLGILAAKSPSQNETSRQLNTSARCKLISPLASSLSGQLYEQTYVECCVENLPRLSSALVEPGAPIDCSQSNPCAQRCVSASILDPITRRNLDQDRCECFAGYRLAQDGVNCVDIDECKLGQHSCNRQSEVCDNTRGSFRCLARQSVAQNPSRSLQLTNEGLSLFEDNMQAGEFFSKRRCPLGFRWNSEENQCQQIDNYQRSASLFATSSGLELLATRTIDG